jgi:hypothetical protein
MGFHAHAHSPQAERRDPPRVAIVAASNCWNFDLRRAISFPRWRNYNGWPLQEREMHAAGGLG